MKKFSLILIIALFLPGLVIAQEPTLVVLDPQRDDEYTLEFENRQGLRYRIPYITNEGGTFKYGDDNDDLVFIEGNFSETYTLEAVQHTNQTFNIGLHDYFVLSDTGEEPRTHIVRYNSIDTSDRTLSFDDEGVGSREFTYESYVVPSSTVIGKAELIFGGNTYLTYIGNVTQNGNDNPLTVDQNADGSIDRTEITITTEKGGVIDLGIAQESDGGNYTVGNSATPTWINTGDTITVDESPPLALLLKQGLFGDQPTQDEQVITTFEKRQNNEVGIRSVQGTNFTLNPPQGEHTTSYRAHFRIGTNSGENSARLVMTYPLRRASDLTVTNLGGGSSPLICTATVNPFDINFNFIPNNNFFNRENTTNSTLMGEVRFTTRNFLGTYYPTVHYFVDIEDPNEQLYYGIENFHYAPRAKFGVAHFNPQTALSQKVAARDPRMFIPITLGHLGTTYYVQALVYDTTDVPNSALILSDGYKVTLPT